MTGNEIAVAVFVHPRLNRLDDAVHVRAVQALAIGLGAAVPFWYALTCLLSLATTFFAHPAWTTPPMAGAWRDSTLRRDECLLRAFTRAHQQPSSPFPARFTPAKLARVAPSLGHTSCHPRRFFSGRLSSSCHVLCYLTNRLTMRCSEPGHRPLVAIERPRGPGRLAWVVRSTER
jgi:hypothetical protein